MTLHDIILIAVMVLIAVLVQRWAEPKSSTQDEARIARLERKVEMLLAQQRRSEAANTSYPQSAPMDEVRALVRQGNTLGAIQLYREVTGEGLKESKDAVDALAITERVR
jgi:ribosomal protein L7/L12